MIRSSSLSLMDSTNFKLNKLLEIMNEYQVVVNDLIEQMWQEPILPKFCVIKSNTWLSARLQQAAGKQAIEIIKSTRKKDKEVTYKRYKKVYVYFKKNNRQLKFLEKKYSDLNLRFHIKPILRNKCINLDSRFVDILKSTNSFDMWLKLGSLGNKIKMFLPIKDHKFNKKFKNWKQANSVFICERKGKIFVQFIYENVAYQPRKTKELGIDLGINCLISTSDGKQFGKDIKTLLNQLDRKQYTSKSAERKRTQIKNYIGFCVNQLNFKELKTLVLENLKNIQIGTKGRVGKTTRKYLTRWNLGLLHRAIECRCEENCVELHYINPSYTSQTCPMCNHMDKGNRDGECFCCKKCGYETNADINAARNILSKFHQERSFMTDIVPDLEKTNFINFH